MSVRYQFYPERFKIYTIVDTPEEAGEEVVLEGTVCGISYQIIKVSIYVPLTSYVTPDADGVHPTPADTPEPEH